jgi:hypothetical protein
MVTLNRISFAILFKDQKFITMRFNILTFLFLTFFAFEIKAQSTTYVPGYYRSNGTYVNGYYKTNNDKTNHNNYSTTQNVNPYTNDSGTKAKDYTPQAYNYGSGQTIYTGPNGGQYYYNSRGNKVYVPKRG